MSDQENYRAAVIGCGRIGGFIDNEVVDNPSITLPYSHAAGYTHVDRTRLVACSDLRPEILDAFGEKYDVTHEHRYSDYEEMIEQEQPDIVSVATQPEQHAEMTLFAATHGVRAIYCEKPMAASMAEADAMLDAVEANGVTFNMGTNRRWDPGFELMKSVIQSGDIGDLQSLVIYFNGPLFNTASHAFDLTAFLNDDVPTTWVKADLMESEPAFEKERLLLDPKGLAAVQFENGVSAHLLPTSRGTSCEAICSEGTVASLNNGLDWELRRRCQNGLTPSPFPAYERSSPTALLIEDLVQALDAGSTATRGGVQVARANLEIIFGCIESHVKDGARVRMPLMNSPYRLDRSLEPRPVRHHP